MEKGTEKIMKKLDFCLGATRECLKTLKILDSRAAALVRFAQDYYSDAVHYRRQGDMETALEAAAYAHGFIDAAVLLGMAEIQGYHLQCKKSAERKG